MTSKPDSEEKLAKKKKFIKVILATFAVCIVVYSVIGALIVDNFSNLQQVEEISKTDEDTFKGEIDDRLRFIAMQENESSQKKISGEDEEIKDNNSPDEPEEIGSFLANEEVKKTKFDEYNEKYRKKQYKENTENENSGTEGAIKKEEPQEQSTGRSLKVVVGDFSTIEAAQSEREKIKSQFSAAPFIKTINGRYTLQVGSFKAHATAEALVASLKQQGYSARIIEE